MTKVRKTQKVQHFKKWYTEAIGNLFFGGFGNVPQTTLEKLINEATDSDFFLARELTYNQQVENKDNYGMIGAAFSGIGGILENAYRTFVNPKNKDYEEVPATAIERAIVGATLFSEIMTMAGRNYGGADLNRIMERVQNMMDRELSKKYKDPNISSIS